MKTFFVSILFCFLIPNYNQIKTDFRLFRDSKKKEYVNTSNKEQKVNLIGKLFADKFIDEIVPQWYGTSWTFTGHTEIPKQGTIACGYFVSTTLRDAGFNLNRYKLAQMSPLNEAKVIACGCVVNEYSNFNKEKFKTEILKYDDGLYFVGLDFHVGFILKSSNQIYFIHSNYIDGKGVVRENINDSRAIQSKVYYLVSVSNNQSLIKKWLLNEKLN